MKNFARLVGVSAFGLLLAGMACAKEPAVPQGLKLDRVVLLMRHGVRPPTKSPPMPEGTANQAWPSWPVAPGYLTPHGRKGVERLGGYDRSAWTAAGLLPRSGCADIRIVADSDERTIRTAEAYAEALAPGCNVAIDHTPQDVADPIFSPIDERAVAFDAAMAREAVLAGAGGEAGLAALDKRLAPELARLDAILCAPASPTCGVRQKPTGLAAAKPDKRPKLNGAIDRASTAAQILLLEYAEGKPLAEVGWGRATPADIERLGVFHAEEFRLLARPRYVARANMAGIAPLIVQGLTADKGPVVTMISGHDTNIASLGGLLDLHWKVPGLATDDPAPGGAIVLERLVDGRGQAYVRALYRSQTVEQIRNLADPAVEVPYVAVLPIAGCTARGVVGLCTMQAFKAQLTR
ncbi:phosphoanhydride phosphohydrolase [Sphingomonas yabuuchiae]|uniref:Phosphoanhydride phosphohydrolase n=1 Tax=Sphingomonas yabuuchiae TaxID=172044 RepID=A0A147ISE6_9SPHN|nr:phosphoanhydride phosphohydrolase [Sphingomonas yabuuchiae]